MECQSVARPGAAPAGHWPADRSALLPGSVGQGSLVTEDPREVSALSGGMMSPGGSTPIRPVTGRRWLAPSSSTRRLMGSPHGSLSLSGRRRAFHVPLMYLGWGRSRLSAGGPPSAPRKFGARGPDHVPIWPGRVSILRLSSLTAFSTTSHELTCPPDPGPRPP